MNIKWWGGLSPYPWEWRAKAEMQWWHGAKKWFSLHVVEWDGTATIRWTLERGWFLNHNRLWDYIEWTKECAVAFNAIYWCEPMEADRPVYVSRFRHHEKNREVWA